MDKNGTYETINTPFPATFDHTYTTTGTFNVLVAATDEDGTVVGFIMGELFLGEYGTFQEQATLDTIGVDPGRQQKGIGRQLMKEFMDHLRELGVQKIHTLVDWNDSKLVEFFRANEFTPSQTINLERSI